MFPATLPALDSVLDSAEVIRQLSSIAPLETGRVVAAFRFGFDGLPTSLRLLLFTVRGQHAAQLEQLLKTNTRHQPPGEPWGARIVVHLTGSDPLIHMEPSDYCPPEQIPGTGRARAPPGTLGEAGLADLLRAGPYEIHVLVDTLGVAERVRLVRSSGSRIVDGIITDAARRYRFHPATQDGVPVYGWYLIRSGRIRVPGYENDPARRGTRTVG